MNHERDHKARHQWFNAANVEQGNDNVGTVIDDANLVLQTALNDQGVALGRLPFVETDIAESRLLRPFDLAIEPAQAYYLIYRKSSLKKAEVRRVFDCLVGQVRG